MVSVDITWPSSEFHRMLLPLDLGGSMRRGVWCPALERQNLVES